MSYSHGTVSCVVGYLCQGGWCYRDLVRLLTLQCAPRASHTFFSERFLNLARKILPSCAIIIFCWISQQISQSPSVCFCWHLWIVFPHEDCCLSIIKQDGRESGFCFSKAQQSGIRTLEVSGQGAQAWTSAETWVPSGHDYLGLQAYMSLKGALFEFVDVRFACHCTLSLNGSTEIH